MFDFFAPAAKPLQTAPSPSNASPFSMMTPDSQLSTFPTASAASSREPFAKGDLMPPVQKADLGSNSPISNEVQAPNPPNVILVTNETPENVGNPDPDIFFFPF
jgi:hypothetical protein